MSTRIHFRSVLAVASVVALVGILGACSDDGPTRDESGDVTESSTVGADTLKVGDCLNAAQLSGLIDEVPVVPCTEAHDAQVVGEYDESESDGRGQECFDAFESFAGQELTDDLGLDMSTLEGWGANSDSIVQCIAETSDGEPTLTESLKK